MFDQASLSAGQASNFLFVEAQQSEKTLSIVWKISDPSKVSYFTLEKSQGKNAFSLVGGFRTQGDSESQFSYPDPQYAPAELTTYRVKMVLANREVVYSSPVLVGPQLAMTDLTHSAQESLQLQFPELLTEAPGVELFDQLGNSIEPLLVSQKNPFQIEISTAHLPQGLYILRIRQARSTWVKRFVKQ